MRSTVGSDSANHSWGIRRSLSAVVVVPDPVRGRVLGRLALGAGQWCPGVHRWVLVGGSDGNDPVPVGRFTPEWVGSDGLWTGYGQHGEPGHLHVHLGRGKGDHRGRRGERLRPPLRTVPPRGPSQHAGGPTTVGRDRDLRTDRSATIISSPTATLSRSCLREDARRSAPRLGGLMGTPGLGGEPGLVTPEWLTEVLRHSGSIDDDTVVVSVQSTPIGTGQVADARFSARLRRSPRTRGRGVQVRLPYAAQRGGRGSSCSLMRGRGGLLPGKLVPPSTWPVPGVTSPWSGPARPRRWW